jgi:1-deoxy-D-xylulose-5-phosphate synthase
MDVALHQLPVVFTLDRAGITGDDGPSHHGMWDLAWLGLIPGIAVAAPRDAATLRAALRQAVARTGGPAVVRYPKGPVGEDVPVLATIDGIDVLARSAPQDDVLLVGIGACARAAVAAAGLATAEGVGVTVVDPRWVLPVPEALVRLTAGRKLVVVAEDGLRAGGVGDALARAMRDAGIDVPVRTVGIPTEFVPQGKREAILREAGLGPRELAREIVATVLSAAPLPHPGPDVVQL